MNQYHTDKQSLEKKIGDVDKKIPDASGLVTTTVLNTKISKVTNKIPDTSNSVTTNAFDIKISEVENKFPDHANILHRSKLIYTDVGNKLISCYRKNIIKQNIYKSKRN